MNERGYHAFASTILFFTLVLVVLRIWVRWTRTNHLRLSDLFAALAWASFFLEYILGRFMIHELFSSPVGWNDPAWISRFSLPVLRIYYASSAIYLNCMYAVKASMIALFFELTPRAQIRARRCLQLLAWFTGICWVVQLGVDAADYILLYAYEIKIRGITGSNRHESVATITLVKLNAASIFLYYIPHALTDLLVYIFPIPTVFKVLRGGTLSAQKKVGLILSFGAGFLSIGILLAYVAVAILNAQVTTPVVFSFFILEEGYALIALCSSPAIGVLMTAISRLRQKFAYPPTRPRDKTVQTSQNDSMERGTTAKGAQNV